MALWCRRLRGRVRSATGGWRRRWRRPGWRVAPCRGDRGWLGAPGCSSIGLLGPRGHQSFFHYSREGLSTGVDRARGTATRCGGSLPHPVCLRPGANPQAPRSFVCLLRESDCGAGSVLLFCARGLPREGVVGEALEGKNFAGGHRWVAQSVGSALEKGEGAGGRLQLSTERRPLRDPVSGHFFSRVTDRCRQT